MLLQGISTCQREVLLPTCLALERNVVQTTIQALASNMIDNRAAVQVPRSVCEREGERERERRGEERWREILYGCLLQISLTHTTITTC